MLFKVISIIIIIAFYLIYFTKLLIQKRNGIKTNQLGRGNKKISVLLIEYLVSISLYVLVGAEIVSIFFETDILNYNFKKIGVIIGIIGVIVFFVAVYTMKDSWRAGISEDDTKLVSNGIYKISRNPAFLGFDLVFVGLLLLNFNWIHLVVAIIAMIFLHLQILNEEKHLYKSFGKDYEIYKKKVFRYFGRNIFKGNGGTI